MKHLAIVLSQEAPFTPLDASPQYNMSDKAAVEEVPLGTTAKPSFLARVKAHFKKWWWAHLIALAVIVLVIALPL